MRAPDQKFSGYSAAWWPQIKSIFAHLGIDADAVIVERWFLHRSGKYAPGQQSLRAELEFLALLATMSTHGRRPARKERIVELSMALKAGKVFRKYLLSDSPELGVIASIERCIESDLTELKTAKPFLNAAKPEENCFREHLLEVWNWTVARNMKRGQRKLLVDFLFACTSPIYPTSKVAIEKWLDRQTKT